MVVACTIAMAVGVLAVVPGQGRQGRQGRQGVAVVRWLMMSWKTH